MIAAFSLPLSRSIGICFFYLCSLVWVALRNTIDWVTLKTKMYFLTAVEARKSRMRVPNSHILVRSRFLAWGLPPSVSSHGKDNV